MTIRYTKRHVIGKANISRRLFITPISRELRRH
jgi:hypothetical protein